MTEAELCSCLEVEEVQIQIYAILLIILHYSSQKAYLQKKNSWFLWTKLDDNQVQGIKSRVQHFGNLYDTHTHIVTGRRD